MAMMYELELFVVGNSPKGQEAERNLREFCDRAIAGRYELRITDVLDNAEAAEEANIIATPTLLRRAPLPVRVVVGDLSRRELLAYGLGLDALAPDFEGTKDHE